MTERFPDGARVCFIGDSLTAQNHVLPRIIDYYKTHFPDSGITFFNCGTAGGTAAYARAIFEEDVLSCRPTHAVVAFGVNDSRRGLLANPADAERYTLLVNAYNAYQEHLTALCDTVLAYGIKLILATPAPYAEYQDSDETPLRGGFALMLGYADFVRTLAREKAIPLCDYHATLSAAMQGDVLYTPDRIHPSVHGYYHMAKCFLAWQGLDIGEETPEPDYADWRVAVSRLRDLYAAECMVIKDYARPLDEKLQVMRDFVAADGPKHPFIEASAEKFLAEHQNKPAYRVAIDAAWAKL